MKVLQKTINKTGHRFASHIYIDKDFIYVNGGLFKVRISTKIYPCLTINTDKIIQLNYDTLGKLHKGRYTINNDEIVVEQKLKGGGEQHHALPLKEAVIENYNAVKNDVSSFIPKTKTAKRNFWNFNGSALDVKELTIVSEIIERIVGERSKFFNIDVVDKQAIITIDYYEKDDFVILLNTHTKH